MSGELLKERVDMANSDLRGAVRGRVLLPGEDGFDQAAKAWNLAVEQPVAAGWRPRTPTTWRPWSVTRGGRVWR
jgi:hypothetical protein